MTDELEYVVKDALMICDKGAAPGFFRPTHNMHIKISGCLVTNRMDMLPVVNIPTFGVCACTGCACMPAPTMWQKTYKAKVKGQETLLARSYMPCALGGKIQFVTSGQIPLPPDALEDIKELQENGEQEEEEGWGRLDTLELVPVVGSIVGAVREGMKGNWGMMAMNIGFLVMDVAGIVSLGATTAAATAGKAAVKAGVKVAAKTAAKTVAKQTGKTGLKTGVKLAEKKAAKTFVKHIDDITKAAAKGKKAVKTTKKAVSYKRPSGFRKGIRDKVWEAAKKKGKGKVVDPVTGKEMKKTDPWDMGHKPGYEFRKHQKSAEKRGISRKEFLDEYNNPKHYRPELPSSNRSHAGEKRGNIYYGP